MCMFMYLIVILLYLKNIFLIDRYLKVIIVMDIRYVKFFFFLLIISVLIIKLFGDKISICGDFSFYLSINVIVFVEGVFICEVRFFFLLNNVN